MKSKSAAMILGLVAVILLFAGLYVAITYLSYIGKTLIDFFSANNVQTISDCGVVIPPEFTEIRNQIPSTILPAVYLGIPVFLILVSALMFSSGYFLGKHRYELEISDELKRQDEIENEVARRVEEHKSKAGGKHQKGEH